MLIYFNENNVWIDRLECARIYSYSDCNRLYMEDQQEVVGFDGGSSLIMEWYAVAGLTTMTVFIGLIALRLAKDELLLRRKRLMIDNY
jgi:hypothetical protein